MRRRVVVVLLALAAVALGLATNVADARLLPYGPVSVTGDIGEDVSAFPYTFHVIDAHAASAVVRTDLYEPGDPIESDGVWVVVTLSYATQDKVRTPSGSGLVLRDGDGREFPVSSRSPATPWLAGADIWVRGNLAFEVAPDSLGDLTLVLDPGLQIYGPMPMRYARIPLDLDPDDVATSIELIEPVQLAVGER